MLAGDRAARVDAEHEDQLRKLLRTRGLALDAPVVEHERMQIAVAGVEDVAHTQAVLLGQRVDAAKDLGQLRARHDAVLHVVVRADAAHRRERGLAPAPHRLPVERIGRDAYLPRLVRAADRLDLLEVLLHLLDGPSSSTISTAPHPSG